MAYTVDAGGALQDGYGSDEDSIPRASTEYYTVIGRGPDEDAWIDQLARKVQEQARELEDNADQIARQKELLRQYESRMAAAGQAGYLRGSSGSYILGEKAKHSKMLKDSEAHSEELEGRLHGVEGKAARLHKQQKESQVQLESKEKEIQKIFHHKQQLTSELSESRMELSKAEKRVLELETMFITDTGGSLMQVRKRNASLSKQGEDLTAQLAAQELGHKQDRLKVQEQAAFIAVLKRALELRESSKRQEVKAAAKSKGKGGDKVAQMKTVTSSKTSSARTLVELAGATMNAELTERVEVLEKALADMELKTVQDIVTLRSNHADVVASMKDKLTRSCEEIRSLHRARKVAADDSRDYAEKQQADLDGVGRELAAALSKLDETHEVRLHMEQQVAEAINERDSVLDFLQETQAQDRGSSGLPHVSKSRDVNDLQASMSILRAERTQQHTRADLYEREVLEVKRENAALRDLCRRNDTLPAAAVQTSGSAMPTLFELASEDPHLEAMGTADVTADVNDGWHDRNFDLLAQLTALKASREKLTLEAATLSRRNKDLTLQLGNFQQSMVDTDKQETREVHLKAHIETLKDELLTVEEELRTLRRTGEDVRAEVGTVSAELLNARVELSQGGEREAQLRAEVGGRQETIAHLEEKLALGEAAKHDEFDVYREQVLHLQEDLASARTQVEELTRHSSSELTRTLFQLEEVTQQIPALEDARMALRSQLRIAVDEQEALKRRSKELEHAVVEAQRATRKAENKPPDPMIQGYEEQLVQTEQLRIDVVRLKETQAKVELQCTQLRQSEYARMQKIEVLEQAKADAEAKNRQLKHDLTELGSQISEYKRTSDTMTDKQQQQSMMVGKEKETLLMSVEASKRDNDGLKRNIEWLQNECRNHQSKCEATIQQYSTKLSVADRRMQIVEKKGLEHKQQLEHLQNHIKTLTKQQGSATHPKEPRVSSERGVDWNEPRQETVTTRTCAQGSHVDDVFTPSTSTSSVLDERLRRIQQTFAKIKSM
jgi:chromosome segregation ATPase